MKGALARLFRRSKPAPLGALAADWEVFAKRDPLWAVLSHPAKQGNRWDRDEFFDTGRSEIAEVLEYVEGLDMAPGRRRALDFGCGPGRLTQALAEHYERVDGVDISAEMIRLAKEANAHGERVAYHVNDSERLPFEDDRFDLVYCNLVLQHMEQPLALGYVREFVRVIRPGAVALFQSVSAYRRSADRNFSSPNVVTDDAIVPGMHVIPRENVLGEVSSAGGRLLDLVESSDGGPDYESLRYCVTK